jgi:plasmid stabilization system protein ParE
MTRRRVFVAPRAEADLDRMATWIADQGAPLTAIEYVGRIRHFSRAWATSLSVAATMDAFGLGSGC